MQIATIIQAVEDFNNTQQETGGIANNIVQIESTLNTVSANVATINSDAVFYNVDKKLAAGYTQTLIAPYATSGTIQLSPANGNIQFIDVQGAVTINAPTDSSVFTMIVFVWNDTTAGTKTLSGFNKVTGDSFDNTAGHGWFLYIAKAFETNDNWIHCQVQAMF